MGMMVIICTTLKNNRRKRCTNKNKENNAI